MDVFFHPLSLEKNVDIMLFCLLRHWFHDHVWLLCVSKCIYLPTSLVIVLNYLLWQEWSIRYREEFIGTRFTPDRAVPECVISVNWLQTINWLQTSLINHYFRKCPYYSTHLSLLSWLLLLLFSVLSLVTKSRMICNYNEIYVHNWVNSSTWHKKFITLISCMFNHWTSSCPSMYHRLDRKLGPSDLRINDVIRSVGTLTDP